jgi:co-chaperonin GroES (HSP10)
MTTMAAAGFEPLHMTAAQAERIGDYFAPVPCPYKPSGSLILVQERATPKKTKGGIFIADTTRDMDKTVAHVGKIVAFGPTAHLDDISGEPLPDWPWWPIGAFVLLPRTTSTRYFVGDAVFRLVQLREILAEITDPDQVLQ